jgi:hypothetical protein
MRKVQKKAAVHESHRPYFIILVTIIDIVLMVYEVIYNGGFEPFSLNPWFGPSTETLIDLGAKFSPRIRYILHLGGY